MIVIEMLGGTAIGGQGGRLSSKSLGGVKPRQLLEMLALQPGRAISKDVLAEQLWDGRPPAGYLGTVESYVCVLRRSLRPLASGPVPVLTSHGGYVLAAEAVRVDVVEVRKLLAGSAGDVCRALDLVTGELLADEPYATWACDARASFDQAVGEACTNAAQQANGQGDHAVASRLAREALARQPFSEIALRELMTALSRTGGRAEAMAAYQQVRERLASELGLGLSAQTRTHFLSMLEGGRRHEHRADRAELKAMLQVIRQVLEIDPTALDGVPWSRELGSMLRASPA